MNGASEATLQELLQINQSMAESLAALAGRSSSGYSGGSSAGSGTSSGSGAAGAAAGAVGKSFFALGAAVGVTTGLIEKGLSPAIKAVSASFSLASKSASVLYQNQLALSEGTIKGTNSLASLTAGLEQLPGILGFAMKAYNLQIKKMEANIATYQEISTVGARFGGSLDEVRQSAKNSYLSLDEFAAVMKAAGPQLRYMGETSEEGAKNLIKFNSTMIKGEVGKGLLGLGYSLQEANSMVADYATVMGGLKSTELKDQKEMEKTVKSFAEELDASAQLEGKTRQQKLEEMKKENQNSAVQARLSEMGEQQRLKYQQAMDRAKSAGEKEYIQSLLLGLPPATKAAQMYAAMNAEGAAALTDNVDAINSSKSAAQEKERIDRNGFKSSNALAETYKNNKIAMNSLALGSSNAAQAAKDAAQSYADQKNSGINTEEKSQARMKKIYDEQEKAKKSEVGAAVQAQGRAKYFGDLMDQLAEILKPLTDIIVELNKKFLEILPSIVNFAKDVIDQVIKPVFAGLFGDINFNDIVKPLKNFFSGFFGEGGTGLDFKTISTGIINFFKPMVDFVGDLIKSIDFTEVGKDFRLVFDKIGNFVGDMIKSIDFNKLGDVFKSFVTMVIDFGKSINFDAIFTDIKAFIVPIARTFKNLITEFDFEEFGKQITTTLTNLWDGIKTIFLPIFEKAEVIFKYISKDLTPVMDDLFGIVNSIIDIIKTKLWPVIEPIVDGLLNAMFPLWDAVKNIIGSINAILKGDFSKAGDLLLDAIENLVYAIREVLEGVWKGVKSLFGFRESKPESKPKSILESKPESNLATPVNPEPKKLSNLEILGPPPITKAEQQYAIEQASSNTDKAEEMSKIVNDTKIETSNSTDPVELLRSEIKTLNNINGQLLKAMKETAENTKSVANILARSGNLFRAS